MASDNQPADLEDVLEELGNAGEDAKDQVSAGQLLDTIGQRSFGPVLLFPALIALTPLGGIPGVPSVLAVIVILIAGQRMFGMEHLWLPHAIRRQNMQRQKLQAGISYLRPVARVIDKMLKPRLVWLTKRPFSYIAAVICMAVALAIPPLELVPFGAIVSWTAIAAFGLALITNDGILTLVAFGFTCAAIALSMSLII